MGRLAATAKGFLEKAFAHTGPSRSLLSWEEDIAAGRALAPRAAAAPDSRWAKRSQNLTAYVQRAVDRACDEKTQAATREMVTLAKAVKKDAATARAALAEPDEDYLALLTVNIVSQQLEDVLRDMSADVLQPLISQIDALLQSVMSMSLHLVDGMAGIIPVVGASVAALVTSVLEFVQGLARELLVQQAHLGVDEVIVATVESLEQLSGQAAKKLILNANERMPQPAKTKASEFRALVAPMMESATRHLRVVAPVTKASFHATCKPNLDNMGAVVNALAAR